jgi:hypothetical protein
VCPANSSAHKDEIVKEEDRDPYDPFDGDESEEDNPESEP